MDPSILNPAPDIQLFISCIVACHAETAGMTEAISVCAACCRMLMDFHDSACSKGCGIAAHLVFMTLTVCLIADAVVSPAFATLSATLAVFLVVFLLAEMNFSVAPIVQVTLLKLGIQSDRPFSTTC